VGVALLPVLGACYSMGTVTLTAANTRAPVLLGKLDRIDADLEASTGGATRSRTEGNELVVTNVKSRHYSVGGTDRKNTTNKGYTDVVLASCVKGDDDVNVWAEFVRVKYTAVYYVLGFLERDSVRLSGWTERVNGGSDE
jgi:hypothetical protein